MAKRMPRVLVIGTGGTITAKLIKGKWSYGEIPVQDLVETTMRIKEHFDVTCTNLFPKSSYSNRINMNFTTISVQC